MFSSILIANRGEIACRVIRTCKQMGIRSIAVYADADRDALFVRQADEAFHIGPSEARLSYLNQDAVLAAAKESGAQAVHPGYGFLSENPDFAQACADAGVTFIGPSAKAIRRMGLKIEAKQIARDAGVPVVPGYDGADQDPATLTLEAQKITLPLLIKASAGGGGRGMRRVNHMDDFAEALASAKKEALSAFGNDAVLLEKYIQRPRHIEVQVLCDNHGTALHLFERDCSVQRNHQKVIEEAPAPDLEQSTRDQLTSSAVKLAKAIDYNSAGTVEYVLDRDSGDVYFLEMNTRLQVEHPVTELITGIDLVEQQIRVAANEKISLQQTDIKVTGWAIEARVAAEDPGQDYLPQIGDVTFCEAPTGMGLRIDSGIATGSSITPWYDSMIAKVIAFAPTREAATEQLLSGLDCYQLAGVGHNLAFLYDIVDHAEFRAANIDTTFLARCFPDGWQRPEASDDVHQCAVSAWIKMPQTSASPWQGLGAWRLTNQPLTKAASYLYLSENGDAPIEIRTHGGANGHPTRLQDNNIVSVFTGRARNYHFEVAQSEQVLLNRSAALAGSDEPAIRAPMPGLINDIVMQIGDQVTAGDIVVVLEAMKLMQNLAAPISGTIAAIHCQPGDSVNGQALLVDITPDTPKSKD